MLAKLPAELDNLDPKTLDQEILRAGVIAELDAINFYEQMAAKASDPIVKKVLYAVAKEEKEHVGEFESLLMKIDLEQAEEYEEGKKEVEEMS